MSTVAIAKGENIIEATKKVLEFLGGMQNFVKKGQTVFIKPDLSTPIGVPASTDPLVIGTIAKLCFHEGAEKVLVGDNPFGGISSKNLYKFTGLDNYLNYIGVDLVSLEKEKYEPVKVPDYKLLKEVKLPKCVLESDVLISIPTMRTDILSDVALSMRNLHGLLPDEQYFKIYREGIHEGLIDISKVIKPNLIILDSFIGGEGQGPFNLSGIETKFNMGSTDTVAIDAIASSIMGFEPQEIKHIKLAGDLGLGNVNNDKISLIGDDMRKFSFKKAQFKNIGNELLKVHQGECCKGCLVSFQIFSDLMDQFLEKQLEKFGGFTCLLGKSPEVSSYKRGIIVFGDCAIISTNNYSFKTDKKIRKLYRTQEIPGCPPIDLNIFEKIALNFKDKIPAFELINEILKRWTKGRRLTIPRHHEIGG
ncbi:MAG: DUF362 domain-containing protein [Candidatus Helarchaeota archaeon]